MTAAQTSAPVAKTAAPAAKTNVPAADRTIECDVTIVGCGVAGLYAALNLPRDLRIVMLSKEAVDHCDSMLAQGGICVMRDHNDYGSWFDDTMRAGHYECRPESVDTMIWDSREVINDLVRLGVDFDRTPSGDFDYTREGAHSRNRIIHHKDITGKAITTELLLQVRRLANVCILEQTVMEDLIIERGEEGRGEDEHAGAAGVEDERTVAGADSPATEHCAGILARDNAGTLAIRSRDTLLATGGVGGLYEHSTNFRCLTGDGCRICERHGIQLDHMDYVQIHPTTLYTTKPGRSFLISESCRGEGAILLDAHGERFTDELQPRDVVSQAIFAQMRKDGTRHVWLSFERVSRQVIRDHFANIHRHCLQEGYDITCEPIPVVPAQHYLMGGIHVDQHSATTMPHLYAAGETSCNGVHGKNRLASNSLLESLVFARLAARDIVRRRHGWTR